MYVVIFLSVWLMAKHSRFFISTLLFQCCYVSFNHDCYVHTTYVLTDLECLQKRESLRDKVKNVSRVCIHNSSSEANKIQSIIQSAFLSQHFWIVTVTDIDIIHFHLSLFLNLSSISLFQVHFLPSSALSFHPCIGLPAWPCGFLLWHFREFSLAFFIKYIEIHF